MPPPDAPTLWQRLGDAAKRRLWSPGEATALSDIAGKSALSVDPEILRGRSVMVATAEQLPAALALIELDGVARRLVLCPADVGVERWPDIIAAAQIDALIVDAGGFRLAGTGAEHFEVGRPERIFAAAARRRSEDTEWVLMTSGTSGAPKLVVHTFAGLTGAIAPSPAVGDAVWSTFYDIRRYGGLQIFLRAMVGGASMVLSSAAEPVAAFLARAGSCGVTHISGTPSHWRRAVMSSALHAMSPGYVRLSGEIADQAILDLLGKMFPGADVAHAFASTEAGVAFDVRDGLAGFPADLVDRSGGPVELRVQDGSLRIRSNRTARGYLRGGIIPVTDPEGFVDTGDLVERDGGRYRFMGRRDGVINVGGQKVHPEEVEAVVNRHPGVAMSVVKPRRNPITGAIVVADIIAAPDVGERDEDRDALREDVLRECRMALPPHKVPALIRVVGSLTFAASGKLQRRDAECHSDRLGPGIPSTAGHSAG